MAGTGNFFAGTGNFSGGTGNLFSLSDFRETIDENAHPVFRGPAYRGLHGSGPTPRIAVIVAAVKTGAAILIQVFSLGPPGIGRFP
jgi:hypothetical protein